MGSIKQLVTIAIIGNHKVQDIEGTFQFLLSQDYPAIEIILSIDRTSGIEMADCVEYINKYSKENIVNVMVDFSEKEKGIIRHAQYAYEKSSGEFLLYVLAGDCFWISNALSSIMDDFSDSFGAVRGVTMLYEKNRYIGANTEERFEYGYCFRKNAIEPDIFRENLSAQELLTEMFWDIGKRAEIVASDCVLIKHDIENDDKRVIENINIEGSRDNGCRKDSRLLNYTDAFKLQQIIAAITREYEYGKTMVEDEKKDILYYRSQSEWGMSESDKMMLKYLRILENAEEFDTITRQIQNHRNTRIKIVAVCNEFPIWQSCIQSVYQEAKKDEKFDIKLVYVPFLHINKNDGDIEEELSNYRKENIPIIMYHDYDLKTECPDIIIYTKPYYLQGGWDIKNISKIIPKVIYIPYNMLPEHETRELIQLTFQMPLHVLAWKRLSYSKKNRKEIQEYSYNTDNCLCIGHPRFDLKMDDMGKEEQKLCELYNQRARHRKIFLWNSHFDLGMQNSDSRGTFLSTGEEILNYFRENKDVFLIWRPHPMFWNSLARMKQDAGIKEYYINMIESCENIYLDNQGSYYPAFFVSDALISDNSSLIEGYLLTHKPIILTKNKKEISDQEHEHLYFGYEFSVIQEFIQEIIAGEDRKKDIRSEYIQHNYYLDSQRRCSRRLLDTILDNYK